MPESRRASGTGTRSAVAAEDPKTAQCSAEEWVSRVPDGGWGWLVVGGSFITTMLMPLLNLGFGVIFSRYLLEEGSSSTIHAWLFNVHSFMWNVMGLMVRPLAQEFGWRVVANFGVLLVFVSLVVSAFTPSPSFLFFSFSLLSGTGGGLVVCMSYIIVPSYFERRRGLANAMMMAGGCTGQVVGPPLIRLLQDEYGFRGATLLLGAILLNCCIGTAFFHPVEWHLKKLPQPAKPPWPSPSPAKGSEDAECSGDEEEVEWVSLVTQARSRGEDGTHQDGSVSTAERQGTCQPMAGPRRGWGLCGLLVSVARSTWADLAILRSPRACIIALGCCFFIIGYFNFLMMVPFAMQTAGHSLADATYCLSASGITNLLMRLSASALSDCAWFNMRVVYMSGLALTSASILVFPLLGSLPWMMAAMVTFGLGVGTTMGLYNLSMVRFMGLENLAPVFGASSFALAVGFITVGPLIGVIRDFSGSYTVSMWILSGYVFTGFLLWVFMPAAQAYDRRRAEAKAVAL